MFGSWWARGARESSQGRSRDEATMEAILRVLEEQIGNGADIVQGLAKGSYPHVTAEEVYPLLQYMEDRGLVTQEEVAGRKVYVVTEAGFAYLAQAKNRAQGEPRADESWVRGEGRGWFDGHAEGWDGPGSWFGHHGPRGHHHDRGWHHHHRQHRHAQREIWNELDLHSLVHDFKHLLGHFKREARHGRLDRERLVRIRAIIDRARADIADVLNARPAERA